MVDVHQVEPGLADGHPWKTASRWQMAWRVLFGVSLTGTSCLLIYAAATGQNGALPILQSGMTYVFAVIIPVMCSIIAAIAGPWLTRYYPFSQSLLFGGLSVIALIAVSAIISVWDWVRRDPCDPGTLCFAPFDATFWIAYVYGFPTFLSASIGFAFALWSPTKRGKRIFWPLWGVVLVGFLVALILYAAWRKP